MTSILYKIKDIVFFIDGKYASFKIVEYNVLEQNPFMCLVRQIANQEGKLWEHTYRLCTYLVKKTKVDSALTNVRSSIKKNVSYCAHTIKGTLQNFFI